MLRRTWGFADSYLAAINLVRSWLSETVVSQDGSGHKHMGYGWGDGGFFRTELGRYLQTHKI